MAASAVAAFSGTLSAVRGQQARFLADVASYEERGVTLAQALAAPVQVIEDGNAQTIENPLKYDYLRLGESLYSVTSPWGVVATAVEFATFIVIPLVFLFVGASSAVTDRRAGTLKLRASTDPVVGINIGKIVAIAVAAGVAVLSLVGAGVLTALVGRLVTGDLAASSTVPVPTTPADGHPMILKLALCFAVAVFFGLAGFAIGTVTRALTWPLVLAALALFVVPFLSAWDPRNLLAVIGSAVFDFWGQFELRPPIPGVATSAAVATTLALAVACGLIGVMLPRGRRRVL